MKKFFIVGLTGLIILLIYFSVSSVLAYSHYLDDDYVDSDFLVGSTTEKIQDYSVGIYGNGNESRIEILNTQSAEKISSEITDTGKDDSITRIIPKKYFSTIGKHLVIGKEYGFVIVTTNDLYEDTTIPKEYFPSEGFYYSTVMVFDRTTINNAIRYSSFETKINILFQEKYMTILPYKSNILIWGFPLGTKRINDYRVIVAPSGRTFGALTQFFFEKKDYYSITNIQYGGTLLNIDEKNSYDETYEVNLDYGRFFLSTEYNHYNYLGELEESSNLDYFSLLIGGIGLIPKPIIIDVIMGWSLMVKDLIGYINNVNDIQSDVSLRDNIVTSKTEFSNNRSFQIEDYGMLLKTILFELKDTKLDSLILTHPKDYSSVKYMIGNSDDSFSTRFLDEISISIVDNLTGSIIVSGTKTTNHRLIDNNYKTKEIKSEYTYINLLDNETVTYTLNNWTLKTYSIRLKLISNIQSDVFFELKWIDGERSYSGYNSIFANITINGKLEIKISGMDFVVDAVLEIYETELEYRTIEIKAFNIYVDKFNISSVINIYYLKNGRLSYEINQNQIRSELVSNKDREIRLEDNYTNLGAKIVIEERYDPYIGGPDPKRHVVHLSDLKNLIIGFGYYESEQIIYITSSGENNNYTFTGNMQVNMSIQLYR